MGHCDGECCGGKGRRGLLGAHVIFYSLPPLSAIEV
jgi:hypothetical protein